LPATLAEGYVYLSPVSVHLRLGIVMTSSSFYFGPIATVAFGLDRVEKLAGDVNGLVGEGAPVLLISDPGIAALGDRAEGILKAGGHRIARFQDIRSDPLSRQIDAAAEAARKADARFANLTVSFANGTLVIAGTAARVADAWDLAQELRRIPGVPRVALGSVEVK